jgi:5'-3' exonuclease
VSARTLLAVDLSNLLYKSCHAHSGLSSGDVFTGGLYGFMLGIAVAIKKTQATDLVICRDMKPYLRSLDYPEYKLLRKTAQDPELKEMYATSEPLVLEFIRGAGIPIWGVPGFESDDLIGYAVRHYGWRFARIVAMSSDEDLHMLLDHPRFAIYKGAKPGQLVTASPEGYVTPQKVTAAEYRLALALSGTHNEVAGLDGIGAVRAAAIVKDPVKWRQYLGEHGPMIERNLSLITLPHAKLGRQTLPTRKGRFTGRSLYRLVSHLDIDITPIMSESFEQVLNK